MKTILLKTDAQLHLFSIKYGNNVLQCCYQCIKVHFNSTFSHLVTPQPFQMTHKIFQHPAELMFSSFQ